jgi:sulfur carrier protein ThiS
VVVTDDEALDATDVPDALVAVTVNVYVVPDDNPDTVIGEDEPVPVKPPGLLMTV